MPQSDYENNRDFEEEEDGDANDDEEDDDDDDEEEEEEDDDDDDGSSGRNWASRIMTKLPVITRLAGHAVHGVWWVTFEQN